MLLRPGPLAPIIAGAGGGVRIAPQYADGLISLYAPGMGGPGHFPDLRNLAPGGGQPRPNSDTIRPAPIFRHVAAGVRIPFGVEMSRTEGPMWTPSLGVAYEPITILFYGSAQPASLNQTIYGYTSSTPGSLVTCRFIRISGSTLGVRVSLGRTSTIPGVAGNIGWSHDRPSVMIATIRGNNDVTLVQVGAQNEFSGGAVFVAGTTSNLYGPPTVDATHEDFGCYAGVGSEAEVELFLAASWTRAFTTEEMIAIGRDSMSILEPDRSPYHVLNTGPLTGNLSQTLVSTTLDSFVKVPFLGNLSETLAPSILGSTVQVGPGVIGGIGDADITLEAATLASTVTLDLIGDLDTALDAAALASFVQAGSPGPFAIRPSLVFT